MNVVKCYDGAVVMNGASTDVDSARTLLQDAQQGTRAAIDRAVAAGTVSTEAAEDYRAHAAQAGDALALDDWVLRVETLDEQVCRFPLCWQPPRPADGPGARPTYCINPGHTALKAHRARKNVRGGLSPTDAATPDSVTDRPVTMARGHAEYLVEQLVAALHQQQQATTALVEKATAELATLGDLTAVEAEIEGMQATAQQQVAEERTRRVKAEEALRDAHSAAAAAEARREDANAAADQAIQATDQAHVTLLLVARQLHHVREHAERTIAATQADAADAIAAAHRHRQDAVAAAEAEVTRVRTEAATAVTEAHDTAQHAVTAANRRVERADHAADDARAETARVRTELAAVRTQLEEAHTAHRRELADLRQADQHELEALRADYKQQLNALRQALQSQAQHAQSRATRAETQLDQAQAQLTQLHQQFEALLEQRAHQSHTPAPASTPRTTGTAPQSESRTERGNNTS